MGHRLVTRFPTSESVRALGLDPALATRLARHLDRYMTRPHTGRPGLREAVHLACAAMLVGGGAPADVVARLTATAEAHAHERGWTQTSVVTGLPRYADLVVAVYDWASRACGLTGEADPEPDDSSAA